MDSTQPLTDTLSLPQIMNAKDAADYLGVSSKTISRYIAAGKLRGETINTNRGRELSIDAADLDALRQQTPTGQDAPPDTSTALVPVLPAPIERESPLIELLRALADRTGHDVSYVPLSDKTWLSLDEAAALSGVPRGLLNEARRAGQLPARKIGRGYKVHRADLDAFVDGLRE